MTSLNRNEIEAHFSWPIGNATLRSALANRLGEKHIDRRLQGEGFHYAAHLPKATLRTMARVFAGGSQNAAGSVRKKAKGKAK